MYRALAPGAYRDFVEESGWSPEDGDDRDTCETGHGLMLMRPIGA